MTVGVIERWRDSLLKIVRQNYKCSPLLLSYRLYKRISPLFAIANPSASASASASAISGFILLLLLVCLIVIVVFFFSFTISAFCHMALRSLNASAPQRSKKGYACTRKTRSMVSAPNDENVNLLGSPNSLLRAPARTVIPCKSATSPSPDVAPVPASDESAIAEIEYLLSENLSDLTDPEGNLHVSVSLSYFLFLFSL